MDFQRLLREKHTPVDMLFDLSPRQFEELIARIWERLGYEVELTKSTRDGGRDVIAVKRSEAALRFLIECKRYNPDHKVGVSIVRELYGVKMHERATKAILATTSHFTSEAEEFIDDHLWEMEARDHDGVVRWVKSVVCV